MLQRSLGALGQAMSALTAHAKHVQRKALEASHEHSKALLLNVVSLLSRDEQMRRERSDAAIAMLHTKMELLRLQKQLAQPVLMGDPAVDGDVAEEALDHSAGVTRALHTLTRLDARRAGPLGGEEGPD